MHKLAALSVAIFALSACVADVPDEEVGSAAEPGIHYGYSTEHNEPPALDAEYDAIPPGPCKTACRQVMSEGCNDWEADCAGDSPNAEDVTCGDEYLTCSAARHAVTGTLSGQVWCYRACMSLD
jgi:hypothetical protein